jgi:hypothetical protein
MNTVLRPGWKPIAGLVTRIAIRQVVSALLFVQWRFHDPIPAARKRSSRYARFQL